MKKKNPPKYLILYRCAKCGLDSGYTERDEPRCRLCNRPTKMTVVSKQKITPEVLTARLKTVTDNIMTYLSDAYKHLPQSEENIVNEGKDAEKEILMLMERMKRFRDKVYHLETRSRKKK